MKDLMISGKMRNVTMEGNFLVTHFGSSPRYGYDNKTLVIPPGKVILDPSSPGFGNLRGVTQFVNTYPPSVNISVDGARENIAPGILGTDSKIFPDGTPYPRELPDMVRLLGQLGYDISAFIKYVESLPPDNKKFYTR